MSAIDNNYKIENEAILSKGITRHPKVDRIMFPVNKKGSKLVILCNPSGYGFLKKKNEEKFFHGELSGSQINKTIMRLNKIIDE